MKPLKVSEVNSYIRRMFSRDMILNQIDVEGEISNFKHHYSGHMYFTLKDTKSKISCVMFSDNNSKLTVDLKDGMNIVASGNISVYEREGSYQLYVKSIKELGLGDLYREFELLKRKLEKEGLFDNEKKKDIPFFSKTIGVVTSSSGAAIRDIINVIKRRNPITNILIYPVAVQGDNAASQIKEGLLYLDQCQEVDLIITGRGGGSFEELFAFNDEELARCIYQLETPIISAVGHETDFTIADFVADKRAPTPSAAAELAVPNINNLHGDLESKYNLLTSQMNRRMSLEENRLRMLERYLNYANPINNILNKQQTLDFLMKNLNDSLLKRLTFETSRLKEAKAYLDFYEKFLSLDSGFALVQNKDGEIIKSVKDIQIHDDLEILLRDGKVGVRVSNIKNRGE